MHFDETYFAPEERDGFYIRSMMKRCWAAQQEVLLVIDKICKKHNIKYFAHYGTMLGTVRHKGFIPWDDDTDIGMLRIDYMRFLKYAEEELPEGYCLYHVNKTLLFPTRVCNSENTIQYNSEFMEEFHGFPYPVGVDIFVVDNLPDDEDEREDMLGILKNMMIWSKSLEKRGAMKRDDFEFDENDLEFKAFVEEISGVHLDNKKTIIEDIAYVGDRLSAMYYDIPTKQVALAGEYATSQLGIFDVDCVKECIYMPFECIELPVPTGYDAILTMQYGDYMTPNKDAQAGHDYGFKAYEDRLFAVFEERGLEIPNFLKM